MGSRWIIEIVIGKFSIKRLSILRITNDHVAVIITVRPVVGICLESDGEVEAFTLVMYT